MSDTLQRQMSPDQWKTSKLRTQAMIALKALSEREAIEIMKCCAPKGVKIDDSEYIPF